MTKKRSQYFFLQEMNRANLYSKYNGLQKNDATFVIDNYLRLIKWKSKEKILDIGSGDGDVLFDLLLPKIPKTFDKIIGVDVSTEMVLHSNEKHKSSRIEFLHLDISKGYPPEFYEFFDHVFSFYCLHWVADQKQAIKNMYEMLKPEGEILLTFLASNPIFDIYEKMAKSSKWGKYMADYNKFISPYHHFKQPESELENILTLEGFKTHLCRIEERTYTFPNLSVLTKSVTAVNPFIANIPAAEVKDYIDDYLKEVRNLKNVKIESINNNNEERVQVVYKLFVVFASKPNSSKFE